MNRIAIAALGAAAFLAGCGGSDSADDEPQLTRFESIVERCGTGTLGDAGMTVVVTITETDTAAGCVLRGAGLPDSVQAQMSSTTAIAGTQSAEWDNTKASWTFSPESGLEIVLEDSTPEIFRDN